MNEWACCLLFVSVNENECQYVRKRDKAQPSQWVPVPAGNRMNDRERQIDEEKMLLERKE